MQDQQAGTIAPLPIEVQPWRINDYASESPYGNKQWIYRFGNGYGASVVQGAYTYGGSVGLFELAVLTFDGDEHHLTYATPITDDVIGHLSVEEVAALLVQIAALPAEAVTP